jgi:hypothetical protein
VAPAICALQRGNAVFAAYWADVARRLCTWAAVPDAAQQAAAQCTGTIDLLEYFLLPIVYIAELPNWIATVIDGTPLPSASPSARAERLLLHCALLALQRFQRSVRDGGIRSADSAYDAQRTSARAHSPCASLWTRSVELPMRSGRHAGSKVPAGSTDGVGGAASAFERRFEHRVGVVHPAVAAYVLMDATESASPVSSWLRLASPCRAASGTRLGCLLPQSPTFATVSMSVVHLAAFCFGWASLRLSGRHCSLSVVRRVCC